MLVRLLFLLIISSSAFSQKLSLDQRRSQIIAIIDQELGEITRLANQQNYSSPDTILRMSELNLEKARLWREYENEQFLKISPEERRKLKKSDFFKRSTGLFHAANDSAEVVLKRFPKYKGIGEVYYILAYNFKELGKDKEAQKYFALASKKAPANTTMAHKSNIALADFYYNDKKFGEAIPLYEKSLGKIDERWWTKDAFNLAWSYYRIRQYDKAINLMIQIHTKSSQGKYIDMRGMVERDIAIFYVDAGRLSDAVKFYQSIGINYTEQFVRVASLIVGQGRFAQAENLLSEAEKLETDRERRITILQAQLELFDKYNKVERHLKASRQLTKLHRESPLSLGDLKRLTYQVNKKAAELQKVAASGTYKNVPKTQEKKSSQAISYFELAALLNPTERAEKTFFQAETAYSAGNYLKALDLYLIAFDRAKTNGETKLLSQSLEGMLASLGQGSVSKNEAEKFYIPVYSRYLSVDTKSSRANSVYVKLFNAQFDAQKILDAEKTLEAFAQHFPQDYKTQEGMLAKIMEHYRQKKDYSRINGFIAQINAGKYKVTQKYADALRGLLTKIQIEGVQQSLERGDKDVALRGYHKIYDDPQSTAKAKTNAAYNLSALYYEAGIPDKSYEWGLIALRDMDSVDTVKFADSYVSIAAGLFLRQNFQESADFSYQIFRKLCKENSSNKIVAFKNAVFISLANNDLDKAIEVKDSGKRCFVPDAVINDASFEITRDLIKHKRWEQLEALILELEKNNRNYPQLISPLDELRKVYTNLGDTARASQIKKKQDSFFKFIQGEKLEIPVEALDLIAMDKINAVVRLKNKIIQTPLSFPESGFNQTVKSKLQLLDQLVAEVTQIQKLGSGRGIVEAYMHLIDTYEFFGNELQRFTPPDKSPEYIASFQKAMGDLHRPLFANAQRQRAEIQKLVLENKILSKSNFSVLYPRGESFMRYLTLKQAVLMDRGGKR
jgi:hypothetical protein